MCPVGGAYSWLISKNKMLLQAENCVDAETIYSFLDANDIGKSHAVWYISYALHIESKNRMKRANEIYNLGICR